MSEGALCASYVLSMYDDRRESPNFIAPLLAVAVAFGLTLRLVGVEVSAPALVLILFLLFVPILGIRVARERASPKIQHSGGISAKPRKPVSVRATVPAPEIQAEHVPSDAGHERAHPRDIASS